MDNTLANNSKLYDYFLENLQEVWIAEQTRKEVYKEMETVASSQKLKEILRQENREMSSRLSKLHSIIEQLPKSPAPERNNFINIFVGESDLPIRQENADDSQGDEALLYCNQKMIFKGIELYGSLIQLAAIFGLNKIEQILLNILSEEQEASKSLIKVLIAP